MYDFVKDNDVKLSTHMQMNLTKKYQSSEKFVKMDNLVRPATVGSNVYKETSKALRKKFRSKSKSKHLVVHELPNVDNLFMEGSRADKIIKKAGINAKLSRNPEKEVLLPNYSQLNLINSGGTLEAEHTIASGKIVVNSKYRF